MHDDNIGVVETEAPTPETRRLIVLTTALVASIDWATKLLAAVTLDTREIAVGSLVTLRLGHNSGVAFGLGVRIPPALLIGLTAAVTVGLGIAALRGAFSSPTAAGLILGGALGNVADRLVGGSVVDFIDLGWWPTFNLADVALTIGCAWLLLSSMREPSG